MPHSKVVWWSPEFCDIIPATGGKEHGMLRFIEKYGLKAEDSIAFGDGNNDVEMLRYAGIGVALGNGSDDVKAAGDYVTSDIDEDGVFKALQHLGIL